MNQRREKKVKLTSHPVVIIWKCHRLIINKMSEFFFAICPKDCPQATRRHKYWHLYIWYGMYGPIHCIQTLADQFILVIFFGVSLSKTIYPVYDSDGLFCSISLDRFILLVSQASNISYLRMTELAMRLLLSELIFASNAMRIADIIFSWNIFSTYELDDSEKTPAKNMILIAWEKKSRVGDTMKNQNRKNKPKQNNNTRRDPRLG